MRSLVPKLLLGVGALLVAAALLAPAAGAVPVFSGKFDLPRVPPKEVGEEEIVGKFDSSNSKISLGPDGNVWFTVTTTGEDVAKIEPDGKITEYDLPNIAGGETTYGIAPGPEGLLWVATVNHISSFNPKDPEKTEEHFTNNAINNNGQVVAAPDGELWVASDNSVIHFKPSDPEGGTPVKIEGEEAEQLSPKDIAVAGSRIVIADSNHKRVVTYDTANDSQHDISLGETPSSQGVAGSPGGQIAYSITDKNEGVGLITLPNPSLVLPFEGRDPFGVDLGSDGAFYWAMAAGNGVGHDVERVTPSGQATEIPFDFPNSKEWFMRQITAGADNTMWVLMEKANEEWAVGRVSGLEPPVTKQLPPTPLPVVPAKPQTKLTKGPTKVVRTRVGKAKVIFKFSASLPGSSFQCSLTKLPKPKKGKKAKKPKTAPFAGCKSPKSYKLAPGKYSFQVRAVAAGGADASPAKQTFKVVHVKK